MGLATQRIDTSMQETVLPAVLQVKTPKFTPLRSTKYRRSLYGTYVPKADVRPLPRYRAVEQADGSVDVTVSLTN